MSKSTTWAGRPCDPELRRRPGIKGAFTDESHSISAAMAATMNSDYCQQTVENDTDSSTGYSGAGASLPQVQHRDRLGGLIHEYAQVA